jgi:hypothetical protein
MDQFARSTSLLLLGLLLALPSFDVVAAAAERPAAGAAEEDVALRIRVGLKDKEATDWSGKLALSDGEVTAIRGWRWMAGDAAEGNEFTVAPRAASSRRTPPSGVAFRRASGCR